MRLWCKEFFDVRCLLQMIQNALYLICCWLLKGSKESKEWFRQQDILKIFVRVQVCKTSVGNITRASLWSLTHSSLKMQKVSKSYRRNLKFNDNDPKRYKWHGYQWEELENIWRQLARLIPACVSEVLEFGCGGNKNAHVSFSPTNNLSKSET